MMSLCGGKWIPTDDAKTKIVLAEKTRALCNSEFVTYDGKPLALFVVFLHQLLFFGTIDFCDITLRWEHHVQYSFFPPKRR